METKDGSSTSGGTGPVTPGPAPKFSKKSDQPTTTQIRRYQRIKKAAREWEQKYYEEKSRSIRILQAEAMKVVDVSSPRKPVIASKVESTSGSKGNEVL